MAKKTAKKRARKYLFPQTPLHRLVFRWLKIFKRDGELWNVLTILRGYDDDAAGLKDYTVGRIRRILGLSSDMLQRSAGKIPGINPEPLNISDCRKRDDLLRMIPFHFTEHYNLAIKAIKDNLGYDLNTEKFVGKKHKPQLWRK